MNEHSQLVTVATFANPAQANVAKNQLEEMGISCVVAHETSVTVYGLSMTGLGSVKLMVAQEDAESASACLRQAALWEAREAEARTRAELEEAEGTGLTPREQEANRLFRSSIVGLFFWPLQLWTLLLLLCVILAKERLEGKPRRRAIVGAVIFLGWVVLVPVGLFLFVYLH